MQITKVVYPSSQPSFICTCGAIPGEAAAGTCTQYVDPVDDPCSEETYQPNSNWIAQLALQQTGQGVLIIDAKLGSVLYQNSRWILLTPLKGIIGC